MFLALTVVVAGAGLLFVFKYLNFMIGELAARCESLGLKPNHSSSDIIHKKRRMASLLP